MPTAAIHIELDTICLLLLFTIVAQSRRNVNQQMSRILFRISAYGNIIQLILDILWLFVEGRIFPGAIFLNRLINALYLGVGVCLGCIWYLYVLETLGYTITKRMQTLIMLPGLFFMALNLISIKTEWVFTVSPQNIYAHGPLFWLQTIGAYGVLLLSIVHLVVYLIRNRHKGISLHDVQKLCKFYVITVIGSVVSLFYTGMPGTWTCAAISIVLIYMDDQNRDVLSGMITAMAADYRSIYYADLDKDECLSVRSSSKLHGEIREGKAFSFREGFREYANRCVSPEDREAFLQFIEPENIRAALSSEDMLSHRYLKNENGKEQYEMLRIAGVRTIDERDDHTVHAIGIGFSDVDRETRKSMEQQQALEAALTQAKEANAAKTAFLSSMSHEIRTPMNAIIGLDSIALRDPFISEATRDELEKIDSSARHLLSLINDILDMSRIESGRMVLKEEEFSFREMAGQINTIIGGQCEDKRLIYESRIIGTIDEYFIGDDLRLRQIIINILGNAVKFTDPPGTVTFTAEETRTSEEECILHFVMKDTGQGIDPEYLPKLFEPFTQEDATTTNRYGGSGLGMALTKNMVELTGGSIHVESEKGRGTTFTVEIPLRRTSHVDAPKELPSSGPEANLAGLHVLIADDIELNAEILADLLEIEDISSECAENGRIAVDLFVQSAPGHFDAILMDMRMPVMDGLAATREIRMLEREDARTIPIIALTANAFEEDVKLCLQAGMNAHLSKPVDIDQLKTELGRLLA